MTRPSLERFLSSKFLPLVLAALAVLLVLPSLWTGWQLDDFTHRYFLLGYPDFQGRTWSPLKLFSFLDGDSVRTRGMMDLGLLPWWTVNGLRLSFWRPLTGMTHWLDYQLWPHNAMLMHLQNLFWFGALIAVVTLLYRRFLGLTWAAGVAALLYAIDDAHGLPAGWIAGRNTILAALSGMLALLFHDLWRRSGLRAGAAIGPLCLTLGLLAGESALAVAGWLLAYAIFLDPAPRRERLLSLLPYGVIVLAWLVYYVKSGYGTWGSGFYLDPLAEPLGFVTACVERGPVLLLDQFGFPPSAIIMGLTAGQATALWIWALGLLVVLAILLAPLIRAEVTAKFWALGTLLSLPLICATLPNGRLLFFVGLGGMGLIAELLAAMKSNPGCLPGARSWRVSARVMRVFLVAVHAVLAPLLLPLTSTTAAIAEPYLQRPAETLPAGPTITRQDLVIVNPPVVFYATHLAAVRILNGQPLPRVLRALAPGSTSLQIRRTDEYTIAIRAERGYLIHPFDNVFRGPGHPMQEGEKVELTGMTVVITELTVDGRPEEAVFKFPVPLEDDSLVWLKWGEKGYVEFDPPPPGTTIELPAATLGF